MGGAIPPHSFTSKEVYTNKQFFKRKRGNKKMEIIKSTTTEKKDIVRANNAIVGAQDLLNAELTLRDVIVYSKADADGEIKTVVACKVFDGKEEFFVTSISPTVLQSIDTILSLFENDEIKSGIKVAFKSKKSKANRDFIYIDLI